MIGKGKSISHGVAALEYDLAKEINGQAVATEIARHELYGCTGAEMVQEMKPYHIDFPNVKNNCLRFEVSPSIEESATFTDADWAELGNDFMQRMGLANHQYIIIRHSGTESKKEQAHLHILANRVSLSGELYRDNWIGKKATEAANAIAKERNFVQSQDIGKVNKAEIKESLWLMLAVRWIAFSTSARAFCLFSAISSLILSKDTTTSPGSGMVGPVCSCRGSDAAACSGVVIGPAASGEVFSAGPVFSFSSAIYDPPFR